MSSKVLLKTLEIEGFRGFRDAASFNLGASAVLLSGPNGTGKTSFFDAVQWLLIGQIDRLLPFRSRKNSEHIVNTYHAPNPAMVRATFVGRESTLTATRRGNWEDSTLEVLLDNQRTFGDEAKVSLRKFLCGETDVQLAVLLQHSGILQQDVMRQLLEAHPTDRHEYISALLGLGVLDNFQRAANEAAKDFKQRSKVAHDEYLTESARASRAHQALREIEDSRADDLELGSARSLLASIIAAFEGRSEIWLQPSDSLSLMLAESTDLRRFLLAIESERGALAQLGEPTNENLSAQLAESESRLNELRAQIKDLVALEQEQEGAVRRAEMRAADFDRLAALAIEMLTESCPVCEQAIDPVAVAAELSRRSLDFAPIQALRKTLSEAKEATAGLRQLKARLEDERGLLLIQEGRLRDLEARRSTLEDQFQRLKAQSKSLGLTPESLTDTMAIANWSEIINLLLTLSNQLIRLQSLERSVGDNSVTQRLAAEAENLTAVSQRAQRLAEQADRQSRKMDQLSKHVVEARASVTELRFAAIQPLVEDVYRRLDPHPTFKALEFAHVMYRARATTEAVVRDELEGVEAEPLLVFSSAQANIVALSYFLAVGLAATERRLPFVMLDDPLQSMDDVNVLGFADLCRYVRHDRQVFVSTHDQRFASLLERKLTSRGDGESTQVIEFAGWERSGPTYAQRNIEPIQDIPFPLVGVAN